MTEHHSAFSARIALVGDRSPHVRAHARIPALLDTLRERDRLDLDVYWVATSDVEDPTTLVGFDGIWLVPGSPYRSEAGAVAAVRVARESAVPFLGTCGGFQHALLEYARNVCGLVDVAHAENAPDGENLLVEALSCSLVGREGTVLTTPGTLAERVLGTSRSQERYHCSYGINRSYLRTLEEYGLRLSGFDADGDLRIAELPGHPFFLATLFQPELAGDGAVPHPAIRAFAAAAAVRAEGHTARPAPVTG
ncbi:hypothetical protein [Plantactinospora sp. B5E13]|uniref:CTP synthase C-terminal region-related (seleno)protein n=1 Tax=unclassified Plantactinospora TaxID=2631981 RepID=UPI00325F7FA4